MKFRTDDYRIAEGEVVDLHKRPTRIDPLCQSKHQYRKQMALHVEQLAACQQLFYAANSHALLLIFQAMDAAGKDGTIKHVMSGVNPQGCQVFSYKHPSPLELQHDFLWRTTRDLPERGKIGIFNRSYYEDVLIVRVHPALLDAEGLPDRASEDDSIWSQRYNAINGLEQHLHNSGTRILKFFLHISKHEQAKRFIDRIDDREKNWKFNDSDMAERKFWPDYMKAYEHALSATSTDEAPWYVIPADDKPTCRLLVSQVILDAMAGLQMQYPKLPKARRAELQVFRDELAG
jgi:PPK2 family polyphosphate:nucleotide phosphotransferase